MAVHRISRRAGHRGHPPVSDGFFIRRVRFNRLFTTITGESRECQGKGPAIERRPLSVDRLVREA
ncbi:hypothetical protein ABZT47_13640 [Sphaerisporangium sp. NPDC005289]|uniref:hypothetical protein n=1 Tax=Sphaerisporangium sp. NPDC005289 TaxID=3155247 RepID=UPI0033A631CA